MHGQAVQVKNTTGEAIPPGGWMEPDGTVTAEGLVNVRKATRGGLSGLVNGFSEIPANGEGQGFTPWPMATVAPDPGDTIGASDTLGPKSGDWYCRVGQQGFRPVGPVFAGFVPVVAEGSSSNGSGQMVVMATSPNDGQQWTTGLVQRFTSTGDLTAASPFEVVELKPLHESERLVSGQPYLCVDTGVRGSGGRRRLRAERLGGAGSPGGFREITVVTSVSCIGDAVHATIDRAYAPPATP